MGLLSLLSGFWGRPRESGYERVQAAEKLAQSGSEGRSAAFPILLKALEDKDETARINAGCVLGCMGFEEQFEAMDPRAREKLVHRLLKELVSGKETNASIVLSRLRLGPSAVAAVPELVDCLKKGPNILRSQVAGVLEQIGPAAKDSIPALIMASTEKADRSLRLNATGALGAIAPEEETAFAALVAALNDEDEHVRKAAASGLRKVATPAAAAAISRYEGLESPRIAAREAALEPLKNLRFEEMSRLPDDALQRVLREIKSEDIAKALYHADSVISKRLLAVLTPGNARYVEEIMHNMQPPSLEDSEAAKNLHLDVLVTLAREGKIAL